MEGISGEKTRWPLGHRQSWTSHHVEQNTGSWIGIVYTSHTKHLQRQLRIEQSPTWLE